MHSSVLPWALVALSTLVAGHGAIIAATGDKGGQGMAIGIDPSTPRDGTDDVPFQQDTTVFDGDAEFSCGETDQTAESNGVNDITSGVMGVMAKAGGQLPQISAGGSVNMTVHQVNSDGAGPYVCMIDTTGAATNWVAMTVTQNVPGERGRNDDGETTDFPLIASVPAGQTCTGTMGGKKGICMVRCQNPQGPFGGCVPVQMAATIKAVNGTKALAGPAAPAAAPAKTSETGGTAEDDVKAIVDAAENSEDGNDDDNGGAGGALGGLGGLLGGGAAGGAGGAGGLLGLLTGNKAKLRRTKRSLKTKLNAIEREERRVKRMEQRERRKRATLKSWIA